MFAERIYALQRSETANGRSVRRTWQQFHLRWNLFSKEISKQFVQASIFSHRPKCVPYLCSPLAEERIKMIQTQYNYYYYVFSHWLHSHTFPRNEKIKKWTFNAMPISLLTYTDAHPCQHNTLPNGSIYFGFPTFRRLFFFFVGRIYVGVEFHSFFFMSK